MYVLHYNICISMFCTSDFSVTWSLCNIWKTILFFTVIPVKLSFVTTKAVSRSKRVFGVSLIFFSFHKQCALVTIFYRKHVCLACFLFCLTSWKNKTKLLFSIFKLLFFVMNLLNRIFAFLLIENFCSWLF